MEVIEISISNLIPRCGCPKNTHDYCTLIEISTIFKPILLNLAFVLFKG